MKGSPNGMSEPPEGVVTGEDIPRENDRYETRQSTIRQIQRTLKARYSDVPDDILRSKAEVIVDEKSRGDSL